MVGNSCWKELRALYSRSLLLCGNIWPTQIHSFNDCWAKCNLSGWRSCPHFLLGSSSAFLTWWLNHLSQCWSPTSISFLVAYIWSPLTVRVVSFPFLLVAERYRCSAPFSWTRQTIACTRKPWDHLVIVHLVVVCLCFPLPSPFP